MKFLPLKDAVTYVARNIEVPATVTRAGPDFVEAWKCSEAAADLHQKLVNALVQPPRWIVNHEATRRPVYDDSVAHEGLKQLESWAGWYRRKAQARAEHVLGCARAGLDPDIEPQAISLNDASSYGLNWLFGVKVGFDLAEFLKFSEARVTANSTTPSHRVLKQTAQEDEIVSALETLGYKPLALPKVPDGGMSQAKNHVKEYLGYSRDVMNKAWVRLRNKKDPRIKYEDE